VNRATAIALAACGPVCVGLLRLVLPYYTSPDSAAAARAVATHSGHESAVLWLGLAATLTLVPGLYAVRDALPPGRLSTVGFTLTLLGYLTLPVLLIADMVLWTGAHQDLDPAATGTLLDGLHPAYGVGLAVFVAAHVLGTVLLGVACLRDHALPTSVGWALTVSQPLHFVTTVFLGLPWVDLVAWCLTALAMGWLAATATSPHAPHPVRVEEEAIQETSVRPSGVGGGIVPRLAAGFVVAATAIAATTFGPAWSGNAATVPSASVPGGGPTTAPNTCARMSAEWAVVVHDSVGDPQGCFVASQRVLLRCFGSPEALATWLRSTVGDPQTCYVERSAASSGPR
jgi:hypothetical protein